VAVNQAAGNTKKQRSVQARLRVAFTYHRLNSVDVGATLTKRLNRSKRIRSTSLLYVEVKDRTAVLRGHVATKNDRAVAGQLAMLEAGVSRVQNELKVSPSPAKAPAKNSPKPAEQAP
jgi:osmotically-inducible protein OsmY